MVNYIVGPDEAELYYAQLFARLQKGSLKISIFKEYGFTADDVVQAQKDLAGGRTTGKGIIRVAGGESDAGLLQSYVGHFDDGDALSSAR